MNRPKVILALVLSVFVLALWLGCDSETTAPQREVQPPVDPIDWEGDKDSGIAGAPGGMLSDAPASGSGGMGFDAGVRTLGPELGPHDHTVIMEAILENVQAISARLPQNQEASGTAILQAALTVPAINSHTKARIRLALSWLDRLEQAQDRVPDETLEAISDVMNQLEAYSSLPEKMEALQLMIDSGQYDLYEGLPQGMAASIEILRDGEKTIYAPRCLLNLKRLIEHDAEGAIAGAIGGLIVAGPPGAGLGAVAGAAGASGSDLVGQLTGWW